MVIVFYKYLYMLLRCAKRKETFYSEDEEDIARPKEKLGVLCVSMRDCTC